MLARAFWRQLYMFYTEVANEKLIYIYIYIYICVDNKYAGPKLHVTNSNATNWGSGSGLHGSKVGISNTFRNDASIF